MSDFGFKSGFSVLDYSKCCAILRIQLAVSTDTQLKQMAQDLTDIVEKVNAVSENKGDGVDDTVSIAI